MPEDLAQAILDCVDAGARVLNVSAALALLSLKSERALEEALDRAAKRGVIVIAAAGNQGTLGSTAITRHPWVIPVVAYDLRGKPMGHSNLGNSIGRRGLGAPGDGVTSLGAQGKPLTLSGTSAASPFVTGAIALLWSEFPTATAATAAALGPLPRNSMPWRAQRESCIPVSSRVSGGRCGGEICRNPSVYPTADNSRPPAADRLGCMEPLRPKSRKVIASPTARRALICLRSSSPAFWPEFAAESNPPTIGMVRHDPNAPEVRGLEDLKGQLRMFYTAFPDFRHIIQDIIAEGDRVATRLTVQGTHQGELRGIAPTGKKITATGMRFCRITNGQIQEDWHNSDTLGLLQQLGVIPK